MDYPKGTKFGSYFPTKDGICRMVELPDGRRTKTRLPKAQYKHLTTSDEITKFIDRLNGRENRRKIREIETKLAFLPTSLLEEFRTTLAAELTNTANAKVTYHNLHRYCLSFFVDKMKLKDPLEWKAAESKWGLALINELPEDEKHLAIHDRPMSLRHIKSLVTVLNKFLAFLHKKLPSEIPYIKMEPLSQARIRYYRATLELQDDDGPGLFISDEHWKIIQKKMPDDIKPWVTLGYNFGLRRSELPGLQLGDIKQGVLSVRRQLDTCKENNSTYKPLKNRMVRKIPYWFTTPQETYRLLKDTKVMHPSTLGHKFADLMEKLGYEYRLHDLRRTFITRALRHQDVVDVQRAAGHTDIRVTMVYLQDDRTLDEADFIPN